MENLKSIFIHNLKEARVRAKLTQAQLAEKTDLSVGFIGDIETGRTSPSFHNIEGISAALQIHPFELFIPIEETIDIRQTRMDTMLIEVKEVLEKYISSDNDGK